MILPITPEEAKNKAQTVIPAFIIEAVNSLLVEKIGVSNQCRILQSEILERVHASQALKDQIFAKKWLDIENIYAKMGWHVTYDKPGYSENYEPNFTFRIV